MAYYFSKTLPVGVDEAVRCTTEALQHEGFGIITEIDVKQALEAKIGVEFRNYPILGACNPKLAHEALELEDKIGTMLPCNVVVQDIGNNRTEVAASIRWLRCRRSTTRASRKPLRTFRRCCATS